MKIRGRTPIPGLGNVVLLGQKEHVLHASVPGREFREVACQLLAWQYYTNFFAQTRANIRWRWRSP